jgi:hypothetical protein
MGDINHNNKIDLMKLVDLESLGIDKIAKSLVELFKMLNVSRDVLCFNTRTPFRPSICSPHVFGGTTVQSSCPSSNHTADVWQYV